MQLNPTSLISALQGYYGPAVNSNLQAADVFKQFLDRKSQEEQARMQAEAQKKAALMGGMFGLAGAGIDATAGLGAASILSKAKKPEQRQPGTNLPKVG